MANEVSSRKTYAPSGPLAATLVRVEPVLLSVLRIGTGLLFMQHGAQKLLGIFGGFGAPGATAPLNSMMGLAGILELFGGFLIAIGLLTRPVAFLLAGEMVVAYFMAHLPQGPVPIQNGGELALLYAIIYLFLVSAGAGQISVDAVLGRRKAETQTGTTAGSPTVGQQQREQAA